MGEDMAFLGQDKVGYLIDSMTGYSYYLIILLYSTVSQDNLEFLLTQWLLPGCVAGWGIEPMQLRKLISCLMLSYSLWSAKLGGLRGTLAD